MHYCIKIICIDEMNVGVESSNPLEFLLKLLIMVFRKLVQPFQTTILWVILASI